MAKQREPVKCLVFSASLRAGSLNAVLAKMTAGAIEQHGGIVDVAAMGAFDSPSYGQDAQAQGFPAGATELRFRPQPFNGKHALLVCRSSTSARGSLRTCSRSRRRIRPSMRRASW